MKRRAKNNRIVVVCTAISCVRFSTCLLLVCSASTACAVEPAQHFPTLRGERYELLVPDTLDLSDRLRLSLNAITRCINYGTHCDFPRSDSRSEHFIVLSDKKPKTVRSIRLFGKSMLGARLARLVTGDESYREVDDDWRVGFIDYLKIDPVMHGPNGGRWLEWIAFNACLEGGSDRDAWNRVASTALRQLRAHSRDVGDASWIHWGDSPPDEGCITVEQAKDSQTKHAESLDESAPPQGWDATFLAWTVQGLTALYRETGNADALKLAGRYARYLKDYGHVIAPNGRPLAGHPHELENIHWHHSFLTGVACAEYGAAAKDKDFLDFAQNAYVSALELGSREVGFAPEYCFSKYPRQQSFDDSEACCTSDLVHMALFLTLSGHADYWDDLDHIVRNQFTEMQMTDTKWFYDLPENRGKWKYPNDEVESYMAPLVGNFAGWATLNEWHKPELGCGIMTCCLGNCTRAMYYVWRNMVDVKDGQLSIHLLLNHSSSSADILSHIPYEGRVIVTPKQDLKSLRIRAPEWIKTGSVDVRITRDGEADSFTWDGRYLQIGEPRKLEEIEVLFPISTRLVDATVGRIPYHLEFKGNTVVAIEPNGSRMPLYHREHYRGNRAPMKRISRFIAATDAGQLN